VTVSEKIEFVRAIRNAIAGTLDQEIAVLCRQFSSVNEAAACPEEPDYQLPEPACQLPESWDDDDVVIDDEADFEIGEVVELNSGGPAMTVTGFDEVGNVLATYYNNETGEFFEVDNPPEALTAVDDE
jgi:uncharacterized protein YodC (DUF2158 family)